MDETASSDLSLLMTATSLAQGEAFEFSPVRLVLVGLIFLVLIATAIWARKVQRSGGMFRLNGMFTGESERRMKVIEVLGIGPGQTLVLAEVDGKEVFLACAQGKIEKLNLLDDAPGDQS
ncbi:flagellar biosynthetic protein FliO [Ponticaulis koreensis]|uniref:flagellar biosynthetic protein FliO n=1 Tax=Ponticaulis koreensis TaxID=1123045 RepID=UPI0003B5ED6A|nr:flagellar biosynthetic protein FliO [Ponticaulis koreensis]